MKNLLFYSTLILFISFQFACETSTTPSKVAVEIPVEASTAIDAPLTNFQFPYQLDQADTSFQLAHKLVEISGLSWNQDETQLLAVNDEQGIVFYLNPETAKIEKTVKFGKMGDYEGVEAVGAAVFVTKSNGTIYKIKDIDSPLQVVESYPTQLKNKNDVEGLGYDAASHSLLLACKGKAGEGELFKKSRAIYAFDLKTEELHPRPILLIKRAALETFLNSKQAQSRLAKYWEAFTAEQLAKAFAPSGIALHPKTKHWYLLSSSGKMLVVSDAVGTILHIEKIDAALLRQAEGICFHSDGTLFISSEGDGAKAKLLRFSMTLPN